MPPTRMSATATATALASGGRGGIAPPYPRRVLDPLSVLAERWTATRYGAGHLIFEQGDLAAGDLYVVLTGKVELTTVAQGRTLLCDVVGPREVFGEASVFDPGPRPTTARALTGATVARVGRDELLALLAERPAAPHSLLQLMARRLRRTNDTVTGLVVLDVPGRLARVLLDFAVRFGRPVDAGISVDHGLTQAQLADLVGAARETVNKTLQGFGAHGWVTQRRTTVVLRDVPALQRRAGLPVGGSPPLRVVAD